jgi:hypothetical protein
MVKAGELDPDHKLVKKLIPEERRPILAKALNYIPGLRYQTADDMLTAMAGKAIAKYPHIVASGRKYELRGTMFIGRDHPCPLPDCRTKGFWRAPDITINDPERYIGKHHAKIQLDHNGACWIEDLRAVSKTAIRRATVQRFEVLSPGRGYKLLDGDIIALAYSPTKGPYMTISYHSN